MALQLAEVKRVFKFTGRDGKSTPLEDPNPNFSPEEVMDFYTNSHPALTTATVSGPNLVDNEAQYEFKTTVGTKG